MKVLLLGDIVGRAGRRAVEALLPSLLAEAEADICIANAENASGGLGLEPCAAKALFAAGVSCITLGNHALSKKALIAHLDNEPIVRPLNLPTKWPGHGYLVLEHGSTKIGVINLLGQVYMDPCNSPFDAVDVALEFFCKQKVKTIFVDFHAEATAEKKLMGYYLQDRVTAVCGTHTHIQTSDNQILGSGTAYITDLGMAGAYQSVLGMDVKVSLERLRHRMSAPFEVANGLAVMEGAIVTVDERSGQAISIERKRYMEQA